MFYRPWTELWSSILFHDSKNQSELVRLLPGSPERFVIPSVSIVLFLGRKGRFMYLYDLFKGLRCLLLSWLSESSQSPSTPVSRVPKQYSWPRWGDPEMPLPPSRNLWRLSTLNIPWQSRYFVREPLETNDQTSIPTFDGTVGRDTHPLSEHSWSRGADTVSVDTPGSSIIGAVHPFGMTLQLCCGMRLDPPGTPTPSLPILSTSL